MSLNRKWFSVTRRRRSARRSNLRGTDTPQTPRRRHRRAVAHLINASVSDEHHAGEKSEVYMFDLSQYSGLRVKKFLKMLDFSGGKLMLTETGTKSPTRI